MKQARVGGLAQALAVAGAMALGGAAHAADFTGSSMSFSAFQTFVGSGDTWTIGDLRLSNFSFGAGSTLGSTDPSNDTVDFVNPGGDLYVFRYNSSANSDATGSGSLTYTMTALSGMLLSQAQTDWSGSDSSALTDGALSLALPSGTVTANSAPGGAPSSWGSLTGFSAIGTTSWNIPGTVADGTILVSSLQNNIELAPVPAPLPILGALAAVGWSRKLRRRIREASPSDPATDKSLALAA